MKKVFSILFLIVGLFVIVGCGNKADDKLVMICTSSSSDTIRGYNLETKYNVYSNDNDIVSKVSTTEAVTSNNDEILDFFNRELKSAYSELNDTYGGYDNKVIKTNGKVTSETTIDYSIMNLKKYVEDNSEVKDYVNSDNKFTITSIKRLYEELGATCD